MVYFHQIIFCLLFISNSLFATEQKNKECERAIQEKESILPLKGNFSVALPNENEIRQTLNRELAKQNAKNKQSLFSEDEIEEMEFFFEYAPTPIHDLLKYLQTPPFYSPEMNRYVCFTGETGTGKSMTAKTIAYKLSQDGWDYKIMSGAHFIAETDKQMAMRLKKELDILLATEQPTIMIIDDLNIILESPHNNSMYENPVENVLCEFFDKQKNNKNFFFIGTMNRINKLPESFRKKFIYGSEA